jgi:hypothetical protein
LPAGREEQDQFYERFCMFRDLFISSASVGAVALNGSPCQYPCMQMKASFSPHADVPMDTNIFPETEYDSPVTLGLPAPKKGYSAFSEILPAD